MAALHTINWVLKMGIDRGAKIRSFGIALQPRCIVGAGLLDQ
jgi:hypothetical protein